MGSRQGLNIQKSPSEPGDADPGLASQLVPVPSRAVCPLAINFASSCCPPPWASQGRCGLIAGHPSQRHSLCELKRSRDEFISWTGTTGWKTELTAGLKTRRDFKQLRNRGRDVLTQVRCMWNLVELGFNPSPSLQLRLRLIPQVTLLCSQSILSLQNLAGNFPRLFPNISSSLPHYFVFFFPTSELGSME